MYKETIVEISQILQKYMSVSDIISVEILDKLHELGYCKPPEGEPSLLSPMEIMKIARVPPEDYGAPPYWWLRANQRVAKAQHQADIKWFKGE